MPDVLVRNLDPGTLQRLRERARQHRTSLQQEMNSILEQVGAWTLGSPDEVAKKIRSRLKARGINYSDSGALQSKDRLR